MNVLSRILKEPLLHFLAFGFLLFLVFEFVASDEDEAMNSKTILVDRDTLLTFIQYQSKTFEPNLAAVRLDEMSDAELQVLVDDYVREEALHREALALSLDNEDILRYGGCITGNFKIARNFKKQKGKWLPKRPDE